MRPIYDYIRRNGNSTKLIDYYIQKLFEERKIEIVDHEINEHNNPRANLLLFERVSKRIYLEHNYSSRSLVFEKDKLLIRFKSEKEIEEGKRFKGEPMLLDLNRMK